MLLIIVKNSQSTN